MRHVITVTDTLIPLLHDGSVNFESLISQHKDAVYRQMIRVCGNHHDAEDVLIEALFKAYRHLDQLEHADAFRAWLARIASRVCWQLRKRESLRPIVQLSVLEQEGRDVPDSQVPVDLQVETAQMKSLLMAAIESLPSPYRQVYELRDLQNRSGKEVCHRLGITTAAMKSRLHRARGLIRAQLDDRLKQ